MISVIIPTSNRCNSLMGALGSLLTQSLDASHFEILVIDNNSADDTRSKTDAFINAHKHTISIRYFFEPIPGLLSGRHRGVKESRGDILVFIDDDIIASENWLKNIFLCFQDNGTEMVAGKSLPLYEETPPDWLQHFWVVTKEGQMCTWLSLIDLGDRIKSVSPLYVLGLNFAIRKKTLIDLGGFHPDCIPSEFQYLQGDGETGPALIAESLKIKAVYNPDVKVFHVISKERLTTAYFEKRAFYQGVCDSYTWIRRNGISFKNKLKLLSIKTKLHLTLALLFLKYKVHPLEKNRLHFHHFKKHIDGFIFHLNMTRQYPLLTDWVLRVDYWDYALPELTEIQ